MRKRFMYDLGHSARLIYLSFIPALMLWLAWIVLPIGLPDFNFWFGAIVFSAAYLYHARNLVRDIGRIDRIAAALFLSDLFLDTLVLCMVLPLILLVLTSLNYVYILRSEFTLGLACLEMFVMDLILYYSLRSSVEDKQGFIRSLKKYVRRS